MKEKSLFVQFVSHPDMTFDVNRALKATYRSSCCTVVQFVKKKNLYEQLTLHRKEKHFIYIIICVKSTYRWCQMSSLVGWIFFLFRFLDQGRGIVGGGSCYADSEYRIVDQCIYSPHPSVCLSHRKWTEMEKKMSIASTKNAVTYALQRVEKFVASLAGNRSRCKL